MLTAAAIRCTVGLWPFAAGLAAVGEARTADAGERGERERPDPPPAVAAPDPPRRPT